MRLVLCLCIASCFLTRISCFLLVRYVEYLVMMIGLGLACLICCLGHSLWLLVESLGIKCTCLISYILSIESTGIITVNRSRQVEVG